MNILTHTLKALHVPFNSDYANQLYEEHPYRNSLYGLSQILKKYGIDNSGIRLEDKSQIHSVDTPCIMMHSNDFVFVSKVTDQDVRYWWNGQKMQLPIHEFLKYWQGVVLLLDKGSDASEPDYTSHRVARRKSFAIRFFAVAFVLVSLFVHLLRTSQNVGLQYVPSVLACWALIGVSCLLVGQQMNLDSSIAQRICSSLRRGGCNKVTESSAAKLFDTLSWSEVGLGFSVGCLLCMLMYDGAVGELSLICGCALPYTFWSVWYQWRRVRDWCALCLIAQALIWILAGTLFISGGADCLCAISLARLVEVGMLLAGSVLVAHVVIEVKTKSLTTSAWKFAYRRIKADENVFHALQSSQMVCPTGSDATGLTFGSKDASHVLTVFTNPYCNPCAEMHKRLSLLKSDSIRMEFVTTSFGGDKDEVNRYLIAAYQQLGQQKALEVFNSWYAFGKAKGVAFFKPYSLNPHTDEVAAEWQRHKQWVEQTKVYATPVLIYDGRTLSPEYQVEDLFDLF